MIGLICALLGLGAILPFFGIEEALRIPIYGALLGVVFLLCIFSVGKKNFTTKELTELAGLTALFAVFQLLPAPTYPPNVIRLDLAGVPWVMAFFMHGVYGALLVAVSAFFVILPFSWGGGFVGAFSKFYATIPMFLVPYLLLKATGKKISETKTALLCLVAAVVARGLLMSVINYYFAGPLFFHMPSNAIMGILPPAVLFLVNAIIGISDFAVAWFLVFRRKIGSVHASLKN